MKEQRSIFVFMAYRTISDTLNAILPAWLKKELALVPVRKAWESLPAPLRTGSAPMDLKGRILIVGVDGAPRKIELSFQKSRILDHLASQGIVLEDIVFKPVPPDRLPVSQKKPGGLDNTIPGQGNGGDHG